MTLFGGQPEGATPAENVVGQTTASEKAKALVSKGAALARLGNLEEAVAAYDEVVDRFANDPALALRERVASALVNKGAALGQIATAMAGKRGHGRGRGGTLRRMFGGAPEQPHSGKRAIAVYDQVVDLYGDDQAPSLRAWVAKALLVKGALLGQMERFADAVEAYDQLLDRFSEDPALGDQIARALGYKGAALWQLDRFTEADVAYALLVDRFGHDSNSGLRELAATALVRHGVALVRWDLNRATKAIAVCDNVIAMFGGDSEPVLREWVAKALLVKAITLGRLGRVEEAVATYNLVVDLFGEDPAPGLRKEVATAISGRINLLGR